MPTEATTRRPWWRLGLAAGLGAAVLNAILYYLYQLLSGEPLRVTDPASGAIQVLPLVLVIITSLLPPLVATLLAIALYRWTRAASIWFIAISLIVAVFSLFSPLALPADISMGNRLTLAAMHLVVAAITLAAFVPRLSAPRD
jgi:hypothetical protein